MAVVQIESVRIGPGCGLVKWRDRERAVALPRIILGLIGLHGFLAVRPATMDPGLAEWRGWGAPRAAFRSPPETAMRRTKAARRMLRRWWLE